MNLVNLCILSVGFLVGMAAKNATGSIFVAAIVAATFVLIVKLSIQKIQNKKNDGAT